MADKEKENQEQEEQPKKGGGLFKILIFVIVGILIGAGGGIFVYMKFLAPKPAPVVKDNSTQPQAQAPKQTAPPVAPKKEEILPTIDLDPFIVNLADRDTRRYLKVKMTLEVSNEKALDEVKKRMPEIRDTITLLLSSKTYADLSTIDGKLALKASIINRLNTILVTGKITNVYFTEFVVQ